MMIRRHDRAPLPAYMDHFYLVIHRGLQGNDASVIYEILSNSVDIFSLCLDGSTILIPAYLSAISAVLQGAHALQNAPRREAITILCSLIPIPTCFRSVRRGDACVTRAAGARSGLVARLTRRRCLVIGRRSQRRRDGGCRCGCRVARYPPAVAGGRALVR